MATAMNYISFAKSYEADMRAFFEDLHQYPEPSHGEIRTNARVREVLGERGIKLLCPAENITIAVIHGAKPGKTVGMRFDTDALQMQELCDLPYKSKKDGLMHGCGHDAHTTVGVYTALMLNDMKEQLCGTYKVIFQPAEEGERGAHEVIATGLVDDCDAFFGLHVWSQYETGTLHATTGGVCASPDMFTVKIHGRGGHGATPHLCADAVAAGAAVVQSLQHIASRFISPMQPVVVTVGSFHAGTRCNIIAEDAVLEGTLRAFDDGVRASLIEYFHRVIQDVAHAMLRLLNWPMKRRQSSSLKKRFSLRFPVCSATTLRNIAALHPAVMCRPACTTRKRDALPHIIMACSRSMKKFSRFAAHGWRPAAKRRPCSDWLICIH